MCSCLVGIVMCSSAGRLHFQTSAVLPITFRSCSDPISAHMIKIGRTIFRIDRTQICKFTFAIRVYSVQSLHWLFLKSNIARWCISDWTWSSKEDFQRFVLINAGCSFKHHKADLDNRCTQQTSLKLLMLLPIILQPRCRIESLIVFHNPLVYRLRNTMFLTRRAFNELSASRSFLSRQFFLHVCKLNGHVTKLTGKCPMSGCNREH